MRHKINSLKQKLQNSTFKAEFIFPQTKKKAEFILDAKITKSNMSKSVYMSIITIVYANIIRLSK